jgi:hypothetical protein
MGTTKIPTLSPFPQKKKKIEHLGVHVTSSHWLQKIIFAYLCSLPFSV